MQKLTGDYEGFLIRGVLIKNKWIEPQASQQCIRNVLAGSLALLGAVVQVLIKTWRLPRLESAK
jgi:hypothetical protein